MAGLMDFLNSPDANLGLSLLASAGPSPVPMPFGATVGRAALQAQQSWQDQQLRQAQLRQLQLQDQMQQQKLAWLGIGPGATSDQSGAPPSPAPTQPAAPAAPQQPFYPGISQMPAGQQPSQADASQPAQSPVSQADIPDWLKPLTPEQISSIPVGGMPGPMAVRYAMGFANKDPQTAQKETIAAQYETAQRNLAPKIATLDNLIKSDRPDVYMRADPQLTAAWPQLARQAGIDPNQYTAANVRRALGFARNQLAASVNLPATEIPNQLRTVTLPDGRTAQIDPVTGKETIEAASDLEKVVGPDGRPMLVPKGKAAGMTPYNQFSSATDEDLQATAEQVANYKVAPPTGGKLLTGNWPAVMKLVKQINPNYDATMFNTKNKARMSFATGKQGDITRSLSVATDHLDQLENAVTALKNGGLPAANRVVNFFSQQTGNSSVTDFNAMKEIVGDEVVKAVVGATGAAGDREAIKHTFDAANSPEQLLSVIQKYKGLMGGQLKGLRRQYEQSTGLKDFDQMVSDNAQRELGGNASTGPALTNARGWSLHTDKNGNKAYVSPDGKQFEEVH